MLTDLISSRYFSGIAAAASICLSIAAISPPPSHAATGFAIGDDAPDFTLADQNGILRTLSSDFLGNDELVILDFCAMWCAPCQQATLDISPVMDRLTEDGIDVRYIQLLVQDDTFQPADQSDALVWATALGNSEPVLTGAEAETNYQGYATAAGSFAFPNFAFIEPSGVVVDLLAGYTQEAVLARSFGWDSNENGFPIAASGLNLRLDMGGESSDVSLVPGGDPAEMTGTIPGTLFGFWGSMGMSSTRIEEWELSVDSPTPISTVEPFTLVAEQVDWADVLGGSDPGRDFEHVLYEADAQLRVYDENFSMVGALTVPLELTGTTLSLSSGPLASALGQPGFPPPPSEVYGFDVVDIEIRATPVPEPSLWASLLAGAALIAMGRGRSER